MPNRLASTNSPYLLQHANNPVDWYAWGPEALEKSKHEDKPIFLSIGYSACHWCHVMAHESFEDAEIAAIMNDHFVNIKVDREEHPDLDNLYMSAVVAMIGQGGWPLNVFLTPEGQPFYGGTYFPPVPRYNMPSFRDVLLSVARVWQDDRSGLLRSSEQIAQYLTRINQIRSGDFDPQPQLIENATASIIQNYDWKGGGWGQAPKFPHPMTIEFLLLLGSQGDQRALDVASHALYRMAQGGMYDVIGGGFSRYSTDNHWLVPHFEKMLYDNAQLAQVYLQAFLITREPFFRNVCEATLDFIQQEMTNELGGFYSSMDADSEGEEGKYYLWTVEEIREAIGDEADIKFYLDAFHITEEGNFQGKNIPRQAVNDDLLAEKYHLGAADVPIKISELNRKLQKAREQRVKPGIDDKSLTVWNALMLQAFAEAARYLNRSDYLSTAVRNADFMVNHLYIDGNLYRSWRNGSVSQPAFLEDYGALILGLLSLYQSDPDVRWFDAALQLTDQVFTHFVDPQGGFFDTSDDQHDILIRPKELTDNATPSGNALICSALQMMYAYQGEDMFINKAYDCLGLIFNRNDINFIFNSKWLCAFYRYLYPFDEIVLLGKIDHPNAHRMIRHLWSQYRPKVVVSISPHPPSKGSPNITLNRPVLDDLPTAYFCRDFVCQRPTNIPGEFLSQLNP